MYREEVLTKVAMELPKWPESVDEAFELYHSGFDFIGTVKSLVMLHHPDTQHPIIEEEYLKRRKEIINEPDDADAPEWAKWKAQDGSSGDWYWYQNQPEPVEFGKWWSAVGGGSFMARLGKTPSGHDWRGTLKKVEKGTKSMFKKGDKVFVNGYRRDGDEHLHGTTPTMEEWEGTKQQLSVRGGEYDCLKSYKVGDGDCEYVLHESEISLWEGSGEEQWDVEELPPVGTVCEVHTQHGWLKCDIVFENGDYAIGHIQEGQESNLKCDWSRTGFRKIKSAEEKAVDDMLEQIQSHHWTNRQIASDIYRAIASGGIAGVVLAEDSE